MFGQKFLNKIPIKFTTTLLSLILSLGQVAADNNVLLWQQAQQLYQQGDFTQAIELWNQALTEKELDSEQHIQILTDLAAAYQGLGDYQTALAKLQQALSLAQQQGTLSQQVLVQGLCISS